jgi:competence protein ComEA
MKKQTHRVVTLAVALILAVLTSAGAVAAAEKAATAAPAKLNINTASAEQLTELPGIGPRLAGRIVEYRQKQGPFKSTQELLNVKGVGERNFQKIQGQLSVADAAPRAGASR